MEEVKDPFADKVVGGVDSGVKAHNDEKMDHAHSESIPPPIDFGSIIRRLAEIEDEIKSRGVEELIAEKEKLRDALKDAMKRAETRLEYDETSNHEAELVQRVKESWDLGILRALLSPAQRKRYIIDTIAEGAVKDGIKNGDLSRGELEAKGAVRKTPGSLALYVRERREGEDGLRI
jgi:hypothetical protein